MNETGLRRFALLGDGHLDWPLSELLQQDGYEIVATALRESASVPSWHGLRDLHEVDGVILTDAAPDSLEAARGLAIHGMPLIIPFGPPLPEEFVAEMSLYDAEGAVTLIPLLHDGCAIPVRAELDRVLAAGDLGELVSLQLHRDIIARSPQLPIEIHQPQLAVPQFIDVTTLRQLGGNYSQVTVIRSGQTETGFATQTLQLAGPGLPDARCVYRAIPPASRDADRDPNKPGWQLEITGSRATALVTGPDPADGLQIDGRTIPPQSADLPIIAQRLDDSTARRPNAASWTDVARSYDTLEAMRRSLRRRRTIDLHFETTSERSQFKTHMATIGCGVILWTMFGIIGLLFAGAVLDPRDGQQREAEAADFVVRTDEFAAGTATLTAAGQSHVERIAATLRQNETVVYLEASGDGDSAQPVDADRRDAVWEMLSGTGADDPSRVVVRPLRGVWFARAMQLARLLVFAPVGLFLLVQLLLVVTRPAAARSSAAPDDQPIPPAA